MVYSPGMVQVSIVTESLLQVAALMQRQRRSSELLKFRQVAASKNDYTNGAVRCLERLVRLLVISPRNFTLSLFSLYFSWFRDDFSLLIFDHRNSQVASFDSSILGYI